MLVLCSRSRIGVYKLWLCRASGSQLIGGCRPVAASELQLGQRL